MRAKHETRRNEPLNCRYGLLALDQHGHVSNLDELGVTEDDILSLPGFLPGDLFGEEDPPLTEDSYDQQTVVILELMREENFPKNSEGYLDMGAVNEVMRARGLPILSGTRRREIEDQLSEPVVSNEPEPETKPEDPAKPVGEVVVEMTVAEIEATTSGSLGAGPTTEVEDKVKETPDAGELSA